MPSLRRSTNGKAYVLVFCSLSLLQARQATAQSYNQTLPWDYSVGDPSVFSAYLNGQLQLNGGITGTVVAAQAAAGGSILGQSKDILKASASGSAYLTGDTYAAIDIAIFGVSKQHKESSAFFTGDVYKEEFDQIVAKATFAVGPFPVTVTVGARGAVGLTYGVGLTHGSASATLLPFARAGIYGTAALDFDFVSVGVGANLTLIDFSVPLTAGAHLTPNYFTNPPSWGVKWDFDVTTKTTLLSGNLFLLAKVDFGFIYKKKWEQTIFSWPGFTLNDTLFSDTGWTSIGVFLPEALSLTPPSVVAGSGNVQLTINGAGFSPADSPTVSWDGTPLTATTVSLTQITAVVPASYVAAAGQHFVTVATPGPLGGTSNSLTFHVVLGAPVLTQIGPGAVTAGGNAFTLTAYGASLIPGSTVLWNSSPLITTPVSDSQLTAQVPAQYISHVDTAQISVSYPSPSSSRSNALTLLVSDPNHPIVTHTLPSRAFPGSTDLAMHVTGTGFVNGSTVYWAGSPLKTTYVSGVQLDAKVPAPLMSVETVAPVDVVNPGGLPSNTVSFTVAPVSYTAIPIPLPPGQTGNWVADSVNANGLVAVNPLSYGFAYLWSEAGGIRRPQIQPFPPPCGAPIASTINGLNNLGQAVGVAQFDGFCPGGAQSFLFANGTLTWPFPTGFYADAINDYGVVVSPTSATGWLDLWRAGSIQTLTASGTPSGAYCCWINNVGQVLGNFNQFPPDYSGRYKAILWNGSTPTQLPDDNGDAVWGQRATGINDFGTIVGHGSDGWIVQDGTMNALPIFPDGTHVINNNGDVIGAGPGVVPYLYSHGRLFKLTDLLSNPSIGQIRSASSITDDGLIAGALSRADGTVTPVLLKPNSPTAQGRIRTVAATATGAFFNGSQLITTSVTRVQPDVVSVGSGGLQLNVSGVNFVSGAIVFWNGTPLGTTFSSATSLIASVPQTLLASPGYATIAAANPGGDMSNGLVFSVINPTPGLSAVSPGQVVAGTAGVTLTVSGQNFQRGSQVFWNQVLLAGSYVGSNQLAAMVPPSLLASPSLAAITVVNPTPGGGASMPMMFRVNPPAPVAIDTNPRAVHVGSPGLALTVSGSGFDSTSIVWWNNTALPTTLVSPSTLMVQVPAFLLTDAGTAAVIVTDTIPGAWPSRRLHVVVNNPAPQPTGVSPSTVQAGHGDLVITMTGNGFVAGSQVYVDGGPVATSYVSSSQLTAVVPAANLAVTQTSQVRIANPQPSDAGLTTAVTLTVTDPPGIQDVTPAMARVGSTTVRVTVRGQGFTSQSIVTWNGSALSTTFASPNQLTAVIPAQDVASTGTYPIRVSQEAVGGGKSSAVAFTVYDTIPRPQIASLTPSGVAAGSPDVEVLLKGAGFLSSTAVLWNGAARLSALLSSEQLLLHVPAADVTNAGNVTIQLRNPADSAGGGGGLSDQVTLKILGSSSAITTDYTSSDAFLSVVTNVTMRGFNNILAGGQRSASFNPLNVYGITISTPTPNTFVNVTTSGYYPSKSYSADFIVDSSNPSANNSVVISFPTPVYAVGLNYGGLFGSGSHRITLSNGHVFSQATTVPIGQTEFAGFVSNEPITSLTLETDNNSWVVVNVLLAEVTASGATVASVTPNTGKQGQTLRGVTIVGENTHLVQGATVASFGAGVTVKSLTVTSPVSATVNLTVQDNAALGGRSVLLTTGAEVASLPNGFTVTASCSGDVKREGDNRDSDSLRDGRPDCHPRGRTEVDGAIQVDTHAKQD